MFKQNRDNFIDKMKQNTMALFYSGNKKIKSADQFFPFVVNKNFYYLTGINQENIILLIIKKKELTEIFLFVEENSKHNILWDGPILTLEQISHITKISASNIFNINYFDLFINQKINFVSVENSNNLLEGIYLDLDYSEPKNNIFKDYYLSWPLKQSQKLSLLYPFLNIYNSSYIMFKLRKCKTNAEVDLIKKALEIQNGALQYMINKIEECQYEYHITANYNCFLERYNTTKAFDIISASGKNALTLHYIKNDDLLDRKDLLLFDAGVNYQNYNSDITRCYPLNGIFNNLQTKIYNLVLEANKKVIDWVKYKNTFKEMNQFGKKILSDGLKKLGILKDNEMIENYCPHSLGHHLGLDVHDLKISSDEPIGENSVITVEPGLYLPQFNIGVRIEDNILITKNKVINLSHQIPKEINEIELLMKK